MIKSKYKVTLLTASICLSLTLASPVWANSETEVSNNTITAQGDIIGAYVGNGDYNTAVGVAGVIGNNIVIGDLISVDAYNNGYLGSGSLAGGGTANRAIGYGAWAVGTQNTAMGASSQAVGNDNTAVGYNSSAYGGGSVALGANSIANEPNTVSVGQPGYERRITNVAPGYYGTDAVNMNQLWNTVDKVNRVGSISMAMSGLAPMGYNPKEPTQYSAAFGTYEGTQAFAVGVYHYTHENVMVNAAFGSSTDRFEKAGRVGITWWGGSSSKNKDKKIADNTVFASNVSSSAISGMIAKTDDNKITMPVSKLVDNEDISESLFMQTVKKHKQANEVPTTVAADGKVKEENNKIAVPVSKQADSGDTGESLFMQTLKKHKTSNDVPATVASDTKAKVEDNKIVVPVSNSADADDTEDSVFMKTLKKLRK